MIGRFDVDALAAGVQGGDRAMLARAISLIESTNRSHASLAEQLLSRVMTLGRRAVHIGITGVPGAGKSTFIEALGMHVCESGLRVAVLAIDPSSAVSGGSILGDRTRMPRLATHPLAFIRPSPSGGTLGGVARKTREAAMLVEAAGFDVILIETVGVGQSESVVAEMVDCVVTLALPGAGDELQGVKRGLLELVDIIAVNKADGDNCERARRAAVELSAAMSMLRSGHDRVPVITCSAATGDGVEAIWESIKSRIEQDRLTGKDIQRRRDQRLRWTRGLIHDRLEALLASSQGAVNELETSLAKVAADHLAPGAAARRVIDALLAELSDTTVAQVTSGIDYTEQASLPRRGALDSGT